jgi:cyanate permease
LLDRVEPRWVTALSFAIQAVALVLISQASQVWITLAGCALYGLSIGNLVTLPALIVHQEFEPAAFSIVLGLLTAIGGSISAFGPWWLGLIRAHSNSYVSTLLFCAFCNVVASVIVLRRPKQRPV